MLGLMINDPNINKEELSKIVVKTLVIVGKKDMIKENHTRKIYENIPRCKIEIISGNHFIPRNN